LIGFSMTLGWRKAVCRCFSSRSKRLWGRLRQERLTAEAYKEVEVGGVAGAIEKTAQDAYERLTPLQRDAARHLFLRLVTPGEGQADTRARSVIPDDPEQRRIVNVFSNPKIRLLVTGYEAQAGSEPRSTVEVAHEALWTGASHNRLRYRRT
jgi:hypothetical protein